MYFTLQVRCDAARLWDSVRVQYHGPEAYGLWYERDVFMGDSHAIALSKAVTELEAMCVQAGWLEPGELELPAQAPTLGGDQG